MDSSNDQNGKRRLDQIRANVIFIAAELDTRSGSMIQSSQLCLSGFYAPVPQHSFQRIGGGLPGGLVGGQADGDPNTPKCADQ